VVAAQPADKTAEMFLPQLFSLHCFLWFSFQYKFIVQFVLLWLSHPSDKTLTTCMLTKHPLRFLDKVTFSYAAQERLCALWKEPKQVSAEHSAGWPSSCWTLHETRISKRKRIRRASLELFSVNSSHDFDSKQENSMRRLK